MVWREITYFSKISYASGAELDLPLLLNRSLAAREKGFENERFFIIALTKMSVSSFGTECTLLSTSNSVTSTKCRQFSSSSGNGYRPHPVTQSCFCNNKKYAYIKSQMEHERGTSQARKEAGKRDKHGETLWEYKYNT